MRHAVRPLGVYKLRSGLSLLGILIGVAAVITLTTLLRSASLSVSGRVENLGTNLVIVTMNPLVKASNTQNGLTLRQSRSLGQLPGFDLAAPVDYETTTASRGEDAAPVTVYGSSPRLTSVLQYHLARGRNWTMKDVSARQKVVLLGSQTSRQLFGKRDPVGHQIALNGASYRVVGVLAPKGAFFDINQDAVAIVPITTYQIQSGIHAVESVYLKTASPTANSGEIHRLEDRLNQDVGHADRYTVMTQSEMLTVTRKISTLLTRVLTGVAAISVLVGGIGMLNVLLMSVSERVREIGIRKSVGARRIEILAQFLLESVIVAMVGGMLGAALGIAASVLLTQRLHIALVLDPWVPLLGILASMGVGALCGIYPAARAAALPPVDALRRA
jgi:putative ABC transport system permease protein